MKLGKTLSICLLILVAIILLPKLFPGVSSGSFTWLIILLCPLMHLFMMKGMRHGGDNGEHGDANYAGHSCCEKDGKVVNKVEKKDEKATK